MNRRIFFIIERPIEIISVGRITSLFLVNNNNNNRVYTYVFPSSIYEERTSKENKKETLIRVGIAMYIGNGEIGNIVARDKH